MKWLEQSERREHYLFEGKPPHGAHYLDATTIASSPSSDPRMHNITNNNKNISSISTNNNNCIKSIIKASKAPFDPKEHTTTNNNNINLIIINNNNNS